LCEHHTSLDVTSVAFKLAEVGKIFSGYQPCRLKITDVSGNISVIVAVTLVMGTEMVPETSVISNQPTPT
jgi:hypothetical protein